MKTTSVLTWFMCTATTVLYSTVAATAEGFTLLIHESAKEISLRNDPAQARAYWAAYNSVAKKMVDAGILRGGTALRSAESWKQLGPKSSKSGKAELSGYFVIDVADMNAALKWAQEIPASRSGGVTIVPHMANPTMSSSDKR